MLVPQVEKKTGFGFLVPIYVLTGVTFILTLDSLYNGTNENPDSLFIFTNALIGVISFIMLIFENRKHLYSLHLMHWIFQYVFFFIAPLVQYLNNSFQWGVLSSNDTQRLINTNLIILLWQVSWILSKLLVQKRIQRKVFIKQEESIHSIANPNRTIFILFALSFAVLFYMVNTYGFSGLYTRGSVLGGALTFNQSVGLLFLSCGRAIPVVLFVYLASVNRKNKKAVYKLLMLVTAGLVLLTNFPSAAPRFWTAAVYLGLLIAVIGIKRRNIFFYMMLIGLNIIFPILGQARNSSSLTGIVDSIGTNKYMFSKNLVTGDYDAFSMVNYASMYYSHHGATIKQFFGALFFFIPRSIWHEKAIGSGATMAHDLGLIFDNVSCPLPAEGLISFGYLGVIIFAVSFSAFLLYIDRLYWSKSNIFVNMVYPFWLVLFFFMMRGDLLSTFSYTVGLTTAFYIFIKIRRVRTARQKQERKRINYIKARLQ